MNKIIISIIGIFVMAGLVYALATFTVAGGDLGVSSLQKGLVGDWVLDGEGYNSNTERITDKTPYENHGTNYGAILTTDQMGQSNRAMSFDGSGTVDGVTPGDNVVITESITNTDNYPDGCTYSVWLYVDPDAVDRMSLLWGAGTIRHIEIYSIGKYFRTEAARQNGYSFGTGNFPDDVRGVWSHFVIVFANNEANRSVRWYQNGNLFHTGNMDGGTYPGTEYFSFSRIGRSTGSVSYLYAKSFDGKISDVRIYNRALNAGEIDTLYGSYRPKASAGSLQKGLILDVPLKSKYTKDETVGSEVMTDRTPYSNDGQNYGATVGSSYTDFDGVDDYINLGTPASLNPGTGSWTVGGWVLARDYTYPKVRFPIVAYTTEVSGTPCWGVDDGYTSAGIRVIFCDGPNYVRSHIVCDPGYRPEDTKNNWAHIVVIFNRSTGKAYAYVNGVKQSGEVDISSVTGNVTNPYNRISNIAGWFLDGTISDVRIYNHALSESEIKLLYDKGR